MCHQGGVHRRPNAGADSRTDHGADASADAGAEWSCNRVGPQTVQPPGAHGGCVVCKADGTVLGGGQVDSGVQRAESVRRQHCSGAAASARARSA